MSEALNTKEIYNTHIQN